MLGPTTVISGGQTGANRAALDWAIAHGVSHGGWCPHGRRAEDGQIDLRYKLKETSRADSAETTEWNVRDSDGTVVFSITRIPSNESKMALELAQKYQKPVLHLSAESCGDNAFDFFREFVRLHGIEVLNVVGSRASAEANIGRFVQKVLNEVCLPQGLPALNTLGVLPPGTYNASLEDVQNMFARGSGSRECLWEQFCRFFEFTKSLEGFQAIEMGGSFLTAKLDPNDIDVAMELSRVAEPVKLALGIMNGEAASQLKAKYGVQVLIKELNSEPYKPHVPTAFSFITNRLPLFRQLSRAERAMFIKVEKRYPVPGEVYKGVVRIEL